MQNIFKNQYEVAVHLDTLAHSSTPLRLANICYENILVKNTTHLPYARYLATLKKFGVLLISLAYADEGQTFQNLVETIGVPHQHNANESFIWDIKVASKTQVAKNPYLARSHQADEFYLHTDCSYETTVPDYFGLYVLQPDELGGGKNLVVDQRDLIRDLSKQSLAVLQNYPVTINVPKEFYKGTPYITAPIIDQNLNLRYRREIIDLEKLNVLQKNALYEFECLAYSAQYVQTLTLKKNQILLLNNKKYLHARTGIRDHNRHLKRIRFFLKN